MRIRRVHIQNFRGVRLTELPNLDDLVVLAGQNGSGKSCVLDAIRLIKSVYGGYQQNEAHQWFGEFQINFSNDPAAFISLFNDPNKPLIIQIDIEIHEAERIYLKQNSEALIRDQAWRAVVPELYGWRSLNAAPFTAQFRSREPEVKIQADQDFKLFEEEIDLEFITASIVIEPNKQPEFNPSKVLELVFSTFDIKHFGIIDYHGPHRIYGREVLNSINVNLDAIEAQKKQSTLYNYNAKYGNVKSEMAALYVREALSEKSGSFVEKTQSTTDVLKELFATFFPDKEFLGPQPTSNGSLRFPVKVGGRETHDLDELSSGEKEILYGYLRLRTSTPKNSVILLDEPELHLNPRLTRNLPDFYHRHLAKALGNQVWLITHSDAILRESVGRPGVSVFHITPSAYAVEHSSQATLIRADQDLERAVIDLVGDLAAYNPGGKIVIFEGEESDFDIQMASELFPELPSRANLISGSNKHRVRGLHILLEKITISGKLPTSHIFSITDRDSDDSENRSIENRLCWDAYHIENYLIEPKYLRLVMNDLLGHETPLSEQDIEEDLKLCAAETVTSLVAHEVSNSANSKIISALKLRVDPQTSNVAAAVANAIRSYRKRIDELVSDSLSDTALIELARSVSDSLHDDIQTGKWKRSFRGRDILKRFVGKHGNGARYNHFRNLIISRMRDHGHRPPGMAAILNQLIAPKPLM
ncbi:ATP-binding protein [Mesorhizobium sp. M1227]|uniref:ATP-binding protein n=1 Tax=Mesorhizobium sp. M1227 TaxID=2957071 RepID=UPI00333BA977